MKSLFTAMIKKVLNFIKENNMLQNGDSVVLGVSGGADSICMLYVLKEISKFINLKLDALRYYIMGIWKYIKRYLPDVEKNEGGEDG